MQRQVLFVSWLFVVVVRLLQYFISSLFTLNILVRFGYKTFYGAEKILTKKIFHGAILESILLNLINETSDRGLHGYAILKAVKKKFGVRLGPSSVYPELRRLEKRGLITSSWELALGKARKQYRITRKGQGLLREYFVDLRTIIPVLAICKT
jgi:PadR family transcriptional regulator PadR